MTIDDRSRHDVHDALERVLGDGPADTLMAHLPPAGWGDLATKHDLALTRAATQGDLALLSADLGLEMASLREELFEMRDGLARAAQRQFVSLVGIMVTLNATLVGLVTVLA